MDTSPSPQSAQLSTEPPITDADKQECLALLRMAAQLRQEQDHIDGMIATLRGEEDIL